MRSRQCLAAIAAASIVFALGTGFAVAADAPPVAVADELNLSEDANAAAVDVLGNDTDSDGGEMTIESVGTANHGTVEITGSGSGLTYKPTADYCGPDSFEYTLNGGSSATVTVTVACVDDPPKAVADSATVDEDAPATSIPVLANDTDIDAGPMSIVSAGQGGHGATAVTGGGTGLTYKPYANYCGADAFAYKLNGGASTTVSVEVTCLDDLPTGVDDTVYLQEDDPATELPVLENDPDIDPGEKAIESATQASHGTIVITGDGSILIYKPDADYCGLDSFVYTLNGNSTATVTVVIACVDDPPVAQNDSVTVSEDADTSLVAVLANDTDSDGGPGLIVARGNADHGAVGSAGSETGLTYAPAPNYCGPDHFTYALSSGQTATVTVTVICVDDPPTSLPDSLVVDEDAGKSKIRVLANDADIDGPFTIASITKPHHGKASIHRAWIDYRPKRDFCGKDSLAYSLSGGARALVRIKVRCRPN